MLIASLLASGGALLCWPATSCSARLRRLSAARTRAPRCLVVRGRVPALLVVPAGAGLLLGPAGAIAVALLGAGAWYQWRARRRAQTNLRVADGLADALRTMVAELRAGADPATAAQAAGQDGPSEVSAPMRAAAASARLGGEVSDSWPGAIGQDSFSRNVLEQLARAWSLAYQHGLPLAEVIDAVRRDVDAGVRFAKQTQARMAGPRASATVLALLPCGGIALGEAMGAAPLHVLAGTAAGQVLLVTGCGLLLAGIVWSVRLTEAAVPR